MGAIEAKYHDVKKTKF